MHCRAVRDPNCIATSHSWEHQTVILIQLTGQRRMRRVTASRQTVPQAGSRDVAETLPFLTQATSLAGFEQDSMVGKDYVYVHQEKASP